MKRIILFVVLVVGCLYAVPDARAQTPTATATATTTATATQTATATATATLTATPTLTATATPTVTATATPTLTATLTASPTPSPCALATITSSSGLSGVYQCCTTTVASSTVPTQVLNDAGKTTWIIKPRASATVGILIFPFQPPMPGAAPSNAIELPATGISDSVGVSTPAGLNGIGESWAAVLETGSSGELVDACWR